MYMYSTVHINMQGKTKDKGVKGYDYFFFPKKKKTYIAMRQFEGNVPWGEPGKQ